MKKIIIYILIFILGLASGIVYTIRNQRPIEIANNFEEGYKIISIELFGQDFNYILNAQGFQSVND